MKLLTLIPRIRSIDRVPLVERMVDFAGKLIRPVVKHVGLDEIVHKSRLVGLRIELHQRKTNGIHAVLRNPVAWKLVTKKAKIRRRLRSRSVEIRVSPR